MKILVTGFDPFGDDKINPAIERSSACRLRFTAPKS
ncbi:pyroglutamyl-peptidase I family protein [Lacticaseibacillus nasuensis]